MIDKRGVGDHLESERAVGEHAVSGSGLHEGLNPSEPSPTFSAAYTEREKELRRLIRGHFPLRNDFYSVRLVLRGLVRMARKEAG